jgi:hypothetical protein
MRKLLNIYEWYAIIGSLSNYQRLKQVLLIIKLLSEEMTELSLIKFILCQQFQVILII